MNTKTVMVFGYLNLIHLYFLDSTSHFFPWFRFEPNVYQTLKTVIGQIAKHLELGKKIALLIIFSTLLCMFGNVVRHGLLHSDKLCTNEFWFVHVLT